MTPQDVIDRVRPLIQDTRTPVRYSDAVLLDFVNQVLRRMSVLRPDLFSAFATIDLVAGTTIQRLPADGLRLIEVYNIEASDGGVLTEVNREALDQNHPLWRTAPAGTPVNYMRHVRNPATFFVYPRPATPMKLVVEYARSPRAYGLSETIEDLSDTYLPVAVDGTVFMAESVDNEHVSTQRAQLFEARFNQALSAGLQTRVISDTDESGLDPRQVV